MDERVTTKNRLGTYLKDRRAKLDPAAFGFAPERRRTPGLRREEVAQRANISPTWYTWLEQGRGGAASADVLDRISRALMLTDVEREHLFLLGLGIVKGIYDMVVHPLFFAVNTVLIFVTGLLIASLALLADLIVRSRGDT